MLFVLCGAKTLLSGIALAHIGASLRVAVVPVSAEVVDLGTQICPNDGIRRAMSFGLGFACELVAPGVPTRAAGGELVLGAGAVVAAGAGATGVAVGVLDSSPPLRHRFM